MIHVTCIAHAFHRVAESIRDASPEANKLISSIKKVFNKSPQRMQTYRELCPGLRDPPQPVLTRWGTWLSAAVFYAENLPAIRTVIGHFNPADAQSIRDAAEVLQDLTLEPQLAYIKANLQVLVLKITQLEARKISLQESMTIVQEVESHIQSLSGPIGDIAKAKLSSVLGNNPGLPTLRAVSEALTIGIPSVELSLPPAALAAMKYAPATSVEVERSFSVYKNLLTDNRKRLTIRSIEMMLVIHCHSAPEPE